LGDRIEGAGVGRKVLARARSSPGGRVARLGVDSRSDANRRDSSPSAQNDSMEAAKAPAEQEAAWENGMCLAIPMKVVEIDGPVAQVEEGGVRREARVDLIDGVKLGDYVIVHAGVAIDRLDPEEARETLKLFEEMLKAAE